MIAGLFNFVIGIVILVGIVVGTLKWVIPAIRSYNEAENRAKRHEEWLKEQAKKDEQFRVAAEQELNHEFGTVDDVVHEDVQELK